MDISDVMQSLDLQEGSVRRFFQITRGDRRLHLAMFPGLDAETSRDDERFYAYLTELLKGDLAPVLKFDREMWRAKR
ncbi:hypothetical protein MASR1M32_32330 [Rhodobacter sp.]